MKFKNELVCRVLGESAEPAEPDASLRVPQGGGKERTTDDIRSWILTGEFPDERVERERLEKLRRFCGRVRSRLSGLAKRTTGAGHNAQVNIVSGKRSPQIVSGRTGGWFTKGGQFLEQRQHRLLSRMHVLICTLMGTPVEIWNMHKPYTAWMVDSRYPKP